jgi:hypothetical protein
VILRDEDTLGVQRKVNNADTPSRYFAATFITICLNVRVSTKGYVRGLTYLIYVTSRPLVQSYVTHGRRLRLASSPTHFSIAYLAITEARLERPVISSFSAKKATSARSNSE